ncbi:thermonuclease family protein [Aliiroseovarius subalbicans]|uniref:thermonuclease family protein n=1 Tax=Aliiroseovarius subalbicans TaxID=2925840 RepID=UPI001F57D81A|nr:thermonuclease family protein [Aliiroseovarius subalbicans]MCI2398012.1 thermonuclease family protein [Aliiroseovarius subalbicans]
MNPHLVIYCVLTLFVLYALFEKLDPRFDLSDGGCRVSYVYDGDTVELTCGGNTQTARLVGFDTPETRDAKCAAEKALGDQATGRLRDLVKSGVVTLKSQGHDKYGRVLTELAVDGRDVAETLVSEGLATSYRGGSRINWCERLAQ